MVIQTYDSVPGTCDAGLSVTVGSTCRTLRRAGAHAETWQVKSVVDFARRLAEDAADRPITHVVFNTPSFIWPYPVPGKATTWPESILEFSTAHPDVTFAQLNHSGMAFLSIDPQGMKHIREALHLALNTHNVQVAGNNARFTQWIGDGLGGRAALLPNLYDTTGVRDHTVRARIDYDPLRIGNFGAGRVWKNQLTAAEAAVVIRNRLGVPMELHVNAGRWFGPDADKAEESRAELFEALPGCRLVNVPWQGWPQFRQVVGTMDLLLSPSFSETFCMIVADGIAEGVPSVVSPTIEWAPKAWQAEPDDPGSIARVGMGLLHDRTGAVADGRRALADYVAAGTKRWTDWLSTVQ